MQSSPLDYLKKAYWDALEADGIEYQTAEDIGNGITQFNVKEEFNNKSVLEMTDYLNLPVEIEFIIQTSCEYWKAIELKETPPAAKSLFQMVYDWGRAGVAVDFKAPAYQTVLKSLLGGI
jgi:hypothetical protein